MTLLCCACQIIKMYPIAFQRLCSASFPPVSYFFPQPHPGPPCCIYNLLEGQPENNWPWEMIQTATNTVYNREQETEAKAQERERRKEARHAQMLATLQGSPVANPKSLKDKARGKRLICRQAGHWAKECPNCDKSPKTWLATNAINWDIGWHSALRTKSLKVKRQAFPHDGSTGLKRPAPASPPVTDNHHGAGAKGATGCGRNLGPLEKTPREIVGRSSDQS